MMKELKNHGEQVRMRMLSFIKEYIRHHGYAPSFREIGKMVGLKSTSSIHSHMEKLFEQGLLKKDTEELNPRAFRVAGMECKYLEEVWRESDGEYNGIPIWDYYCPVCGEAFEEYESHPVNYCQNCGTKILKPKCEEDDDE